MIGLLRPWRRQLQRENVVADRTKEQILNQAIYAVACVARHYGGGFSAEGLQDVRRLLSKMPWGTDSGYRVDVSDEDQFADFEPRIIHPLDWWKLDFSEVVARSEERED